MAVTLCQSEGTHQIVMSFTPPAEGGLLKKGLQKGWGGGELSWAPQVPHSYTPGIHLL